MKLILHVARCWSCFATALFCACLSVSAQAAGPAGGAIQGTLFSAGGTPVTSNNVTFKIQVMDKNAACVLYEETHTGVDLSATNGDFSFDLGYGGVRTNNVDGSAILKANVFRNDVNIAPGQPWCAPGVVFASGDPRVIRVQFDVGGGFVTLTPDMRLQGSVYSSVAETVQGKAPTDFVQIKDDGSTVSLSQSNLESAFSFANYPKLMALINGTSTQYLTGAPTSSMDLNNQRITNLANPTAAQDAVTKNYADTYVAGKQLDLQDVGVGTGGGKVLVWDQAQNKWVAQTITAVGNAGGDLSGTYPNPSIANNAVTSAKINDGAIATADLADASVSPVKLVSGTAAVNRMFLSDGITGTSFAEKTCANDEVLKYSIATGWTCTSVAAVAPVPQVEGRTGNVDIDLADIQSAGTAAARNVGSGVGDVVTVQAGGKLPALDGSDLTNVNAVKLQGRDVANAGPNPGDVLTWNNGTSKWEPTAAPSAPVSSVATKTGAVTLDWGDINNAAGKYLTYKPNDTACGNDEILKFDGTKWVCASAGSTLETASGNVGIGTTSPAEQLDVAGAIRIGTTATTCDPAHAGGLRYNGGAMEFCDGANWTALGTAAGGEVNTASNVGSAGVGVFNQKTGVNLEFKKLNALSNKISITNDAGNSKIDFDIDQTKIDHDQLLNFAANEHVDHSSVSIATAAGTSGLSGGGDLTSTRNLIVDITGTGALGAAADNADEIMIYDTSASALKKVTRSQLNLSEAEVDSMVGNNGYAADTNVLKKDGSVQLTADWDVGAKKLTNLAAPAASGDAATKGYADGKIGGSTLDLTGLTDGQVLKWDNTASKWVPFSISASGESNTASNVGSAGVGIFNQKSGVNLEFKKVNALSNKILITNDAGNSKVDFDIDQTKIDHDQLLNFVANEHVDHSSVNIATAAGTSGLSGGGDLTSTRNLIVDITGTSALGAAADNADEILIYDTSGTALKKVTRAQLNLSESEVDTMVGNNGYAADSGVLKKDGSVALTGNFQTGGKWLSNDAGNEGIYIDTNGNVGVGNSAPARLLDVAGPIRVGVSALPGSPAAGDIAVDSGDANKLKWYNGSGWQTVGTSTASGDINNGGNNGAITIGSNDNNLSLEANNVERVRITPDSVRVIPSALPGTPAAGDVVIDSADANKLKFHNGTSWVTVGSGSGTGDFMKDGSVAMTGNFKLGNNWLSNDGDPEGLRVDGNGNVGIGTTTPDSLLTLSKSLTAVPGTRLQSLNVNTTVAPTAALDWPDTRHGIDSTTTVPAGNTNSIKEVVGNRTHVENLGSGGIYRLVGNEAYAEHNNPAHTGTWLEGSFNFAGNWDGNWTGGVYGAMNEAESDSGTVNAFGGTYSWSGTWGGTATNQYGVNVNVQSESSAVVTNRYGIMIKNTGAVVPTNDFGVYQESISAKNYFGGKVGIGTTSPGQLLHVNGPMRVQPAALPGTPGAGDIAIDSGDANKLKFHNGTSWVTVGSGTGTGDFMKDGSVAMTGNFRSGGNWISNDGGNEGLFVDTAGNVGVGTSAPLQPLQVDRTYTSGANGNYQGITTNVTVNPSSNQGLAAINVGNNVNLVTDPGGTSSVGQLYGEYVSVSHQNSQNLIRMMGGKHAAWNTGGGTITQSQIGEYASTGISASGGSVAARYGVLTENYTQGGTVTDAYGVAIKDFFSAGTITNRYGLYLELTGTATTADYGIYQSTAQNNYFAGAIGAGVSNPARPLHVNGAARLQPAALPGTPGAGDLAIDSGDANKLKFHNGTSWVTVGSGSGTGDFMKDGSVAMTGNLKLGGNWLSNDGDSEGIAIDNAGNVGIGTTTPARNLSAVADDAVTNGVSYPMRLSHTTTGTAADGMATGIEFEVEDPSGTPEVIGSQVYERYADTSGTSTWFTNMMYTGGVNTAPIDWGTWQAGAAGSFATQLDLVSAGNEGSYLSLRRARGTQGAKSSLQNGDIISTIEFVGHDGTSFNYVSANIQAAVDGPTATADIPTRLLFGTSAAGSGVATTRMTITSAGDVGIGTTSPGRLLHVNGAARLQPTALPGTPAAGDIAIDSGDANKLKFHNGTSWVTVGAAGAGGDFMKDGSVNMTGTFKAVDGTAALPGITFASDTGNGISLPAADTMAFSTNGTEKMRLDANGSLGIGTTAPGAILDLRRNTSGASDATISSNLVVTGTGSATGAGAMNNFVTTNGTGGVGSLYGVYSTIDNFNSGGANQIMGMGAEAWNDAGNVNNLYGLLLYTGAFGNNATNIYGARITGTQLNNTTVSNMYGVKIESPAGGWGTTTVANNYALYIENPARAGISSAYSIYSAGGQNYFAGNVGVGTTSPNNQLHLRDAGGNATPTSRPPAWVQGYIERDFIAGSSAGFAIQGGDKAAGGNGILFLGNADEYDSTSIKGAAGTLTFSTRNGGAALAEAVTIKPDGSLGVGTTTPGRLLHVNGVARLQPTSLPGTPGAGDLAVDSSDSNKLKFHNGTSWVTLGQPTDFGAGTAIAFDPASGTQATSAGIVVAYGARNANNAAGCALTALSDNNSNPTTVVAQTNSVNNAGSNISITFPVKSGNYYKVTTNGNCTGSAGKFYAISGAGGAGGGVGDFLKDGSVAMTGNLKLGANYISNDGGAGEGLSFDTNGNATFSGTITGNGSGLTNIGSAAITDGSIGINDLSFASNNGINVPQLAANPASPTAGQIYYNTATNKLMVYNGSTWVEAGSGGGGGSTGLSFRAHRNGVAQTIPSATFTVIDFTTESHDPSAAFDLTTDRFTPQTSGYYYFAVKTTAVSSLVAGSYLTAQIRKNGSAISEAWTVSTGSSVPASAASVVVFMNGTTDYVDATVYQNHGSNLDIDGWAPRTNFEGFLISGGGGSDNLGNHTLTQNLITGSNWLSGDGGNEGLYVNSSGNVGVGTTNPGSALDVKGVLRLDGSSSGYSALQSPATGGNVTWTLPTADGSNGYLLTTNGSGALSWTSPSAAVTAAVAPSFSVHRNGTFQTVTQGITTKLTWTTETFDTNNNFSTATSRYTPTIAGKYIISLNVGCTNAGGVNVSYCQPYINKNGTTISATGPATTTALNGMGAELTTIVDMNGTTDYLEAYVTTDTNRIDGASYWTNFSGALLAPLASGSVAGTGTANYIPMWTSASALSDSPLAVSSGSVGLGTSAANASALLDMSSTSKGFLPPRMTTAQRTAISSPAAGLIVFDTDLSALYIYKSGAWSAVGSGGSGSDMSFFVTKSTNQSMPTSNTIYKVNWEAETFDPGNAFDLTNDRFQPTVAGKYLVQMVAQTAVLCDTCRMEAQIYKNTTMVTFQVVRGNTNTSSTVNAFALVDLNGTTDYVEFKMTSGSGSLTVDAAGTTGQGFLISGGGGGGGGSGDFLANGSVNMTGAFKAADGTAALPGISFASDPNTGLFGTGSDILGLSTAGNERLRIDASGTVGIGTSTPSASALVDMSSTTKGFLPPRMTTAQRNAISSPAEGLIVFDTDIKAVYTYKNSAWTKMADSSDVSFHVKKTSNQSLTASTNSYVNWQSETYDVGNSFDLTTDRFTPTVAGKYMIVYSVRFNSLATSNYGQIWLEKNGTDVADGWAYPANNNASVLVVAMVDMNGSTDYIRFGVISDTAAVVASNAETTYAQGYLISGGTGAGGGSDNLGNHTLTQNIITGTNWISGDGGNEGLYVDSSGNVGIGRTNPSLSLDVAGGMQLMYSMFVKSYGAMLPGVTQTYARNTEATPLIVANNDQLSNLFTSGYDGGAYRQAAIIRVSVDGTPGASDMPARIEFHTTPDGASTAQERMRITNVGNVGIGTTTPNHNLDVAGNIGLSASGYLNFGSTDGSTGYGIRDNAGTIECKNSGGAWVACADGGIDYLFAKSGAQANVAANTVVNFTAVDASSGTNVTLNTTTDQFTLKAGRTYRLTGQVKLDSISPSGWVDYRWYNVSASSWMGTWGGAISSNYASTASEYSLAVAYLTPATDTVVEFRIDSGTAGMDVAATAVWIEALGGGGAGGGAADNLGNHTLTQNLVTGTNWISGDGGNEGLYVAASGNVGIGTTSPSQNLDVAGGFIRSRADGAIWPGFIGINYSGTNAFSSGTLLLQKGRGTESSPSYALSGDYLGSVVFRNHNNTGGSLVVGAASENQSAATGGSELQFMTTLNGTNTSSTRMTITNDGHVGIGTTNPGQMLSVNGMIESITGGIKFPDGSIQTSAGGSGPFKGAKLSQAISVPNGWTYGLSSFTAGGVAYDTGSFWNSGQPARLTVPSGVTYVRVRAFMEVGSTCTVCQVQIQKNGAGYIASSYGGSGNTGFGGNQFWVLTDPVPVVAGDYFDMTTYQNTGSAQSYWVEFSIEAVNGQTVSAGGSGSANYIPKFTSSTALANSLIYDSGTNIGIGTTNPGSAKLTVLGTSTIADPGVSTILTGTGYKLAVQGFHSKTVSNDNAILGLFTNDAAASNPLVMALSVTGNATTANRYGYIQVNEYGTGTWSTLALNPNGGSVGIGTTAPAAKLDVAGEVKFGNTSSTCNAANEGQQRYNSTLKQMEFCNGSAWKTFRQHVTRCRFQYGAAGATGWMGAHTWVAGDCSDGLPNKSGATYAIIEGSPDTGGGSNGGNLTCTTTQGNAFAPVAGQAYAVACLFVEHD